MGGLGHADRLYYVTIAATMHVLVQEAQRGAVICGIRAGKTTREIADFNNIAMGTVKQISKAYRTFIEQGGEDAEYDIKRKTPRRRSEAHGAEIVAQVQELINQDPGRSMRKIAADLGVSDFLIRKIVKEDIRYRSYALRKGQFMSEATKIVRYEKARGLLNRLKHPPAEDLLIFFSDEKNFSQDQKVNSRNNRWLCDDPSEVPIVMKTKFPATVMCMGVISNKGDVMLPHFFPTGLKINTDVYLDLLNNVVKPWMDQIAAGRPFIWQQDGVPAHNSNRTQEWCRENLPFFFEKEVWPPNSPDCNPLDYYVWGVAERDANRTSHNTKEALMARIVEVFANIPKADVVKACSRFRSRIEKVVAANGDFFE